MSAGQELDAARLRDTVRDISDFPEPGVVFKDITPLLGDPIAFKLALDALCEPFADQSIDRVLGVEARGFILAGPVADRFGAGFVPVRKAGKLPWKIEREEYELEYGTDLLEIHRDAVKPGDRVLLVDDVMATGGTAAAAARLVARFDAELVGVAVLIELEFLGGRAKLDGSLIHSVLTYEEA